MDVQKQKQIKAKLYNLKNGIEGLFPLIDSGVLELDRIGEAVASLSAKAVDDLMTVQ